jgi:hypothetical protein
VEAVELAGALERAEKGFYLVFLFLKSFSIQGFWDIH